MKSYYRKRITGIPEMDCARATVGRHGLARAISDAVFYDHFTPLVLPHWRSSVSASVGRRRTSSGTGDRAGGTAAINPHGGSSVRPTFTA